MRHHATTRFAARTRPRILSPGVEEPKLTTRQRAELVRIHASGEYTIAELMEVFSIGRATVHRVLDRAKQRDSP